MSFYFVGEGKKMMNDQQKLELPLSGAPPVSGQQVGLLLPEAPPAPAPQVDLLPPRSSRRPIVVTGVLVTACLLLVSVLLFAAWGSALLTPRVHSQTIARHTTPRGPRQTPILPATPTATPQSALVVSQIDRLLTNQVAHQQFSGSVLIAQDGHVLLSKGYSMADWDDQVPNTPHTKFYLGSTTKEFTAMAILILQEQGKLHVSDHLCPYI